MRDIKGMNIEYNKSRNEFIKIVSEYQGKLTEQKDVVCFDADNIVTSYYQGGKIHKQKKMPCHFELEKVGERIVISGYEKSYEIIGGFGLTYSKETLLGELRRYNFTKKQQYLANHQISMFELLGV